MNFSRVQAQIPLFSFTDTSVCEGEWIKFENLHPDYCGYDYLWDFGDGNQDTARQKVVWHNYAQPGTYTASLSMPNDNYLYILKSVTVTAIPANWINLPFDTRPDIYFKFRGDSCQTHNFETHRYASNLTLPHTFQLNRQLGRGTYEVQVWDYDASLFDDKIGEFPLNMAGGSGSYTKSYVLGDLKVSWVIDSIPISTYSQTIVVEPGPTAPVIQATGPLKVCGDSVVLFAFSNNGIVLQWYKDGNLIGSGDTLIATETGNYVVEALNPSGCSPMSRPELVVIGGGALSPIVSVDGGLSQPRKYICLNGSKWISGPELYGGSGKNGAHYSLTYHTFTWYKDGIIQANPGIHTNYFTPHEAGNYWVVVTDSVGCYGTSDTIPVSAHINTPPEIFPKDTAYYCGQDTLLLQTNTSHWLKYQWYKDFQPIPDSLGGQNPSLEVFEAGIYSIIHDDSAGCFLPVHISNAPYVNVIDPEGVPYPVDLTRNGDTLFTIAADAYQWIDANSQQILSSDPYFIPTQQGVYYASVIDTNGCEAKSEIIHFYMTGLDSNLPQMGVKIYPNPSNGVLTVQLNQLTEKKGELSIYSLSGQTIRKIEITQLQAEYDFTDLPDGVFLIQIGVEGYTPVTRKLVISH